MPRCVILCQLIMKSKAFVVSWMHCVDGRAMNGLSLPRFTALSCNLALGTQVSDWCYVSVSAYAPTRFALCVWQGNTGPCLRAARGTWMQQEEGPGQRTILTRMTLFFSMPNAQERRVHVITGKEPHSARRTPAGRRMSLWNQHKEGVDRSHLPEWFILRSISTLKGLYILYYILKVDFTSLHEYLSDMSRCTEIV